jgi:hypothetical protein
MIPSFVILLPPSSSLPVRVRTQTGRPDDIAGISQLLYNGTMRKKSLFETNHHLKDSAKYRTSLLSNVSSSTAIETNDSVQVVAGKMTASKGGMFHVSRPKRK